MSEARGRRSESIKKSVAVSLVSKVLGTVIMFAAMPFASHRLGGGYNAFGALTTLGWIINLVNLGVGPGLAIELTRYAVDGNEEEEKAWFASGFWVGILSSFIVFLVVVVVALTVPMEVIFGSRLAAYADELRLGLLLFGGLSFVNASMITFAQAYAGYLEDYKARTVMTVGYGLSIPVIWAVATYAPGPAYLAVAVHGPPIVSQLFNIYRLLVRDRPYLVPRLSNIVREKAAVLWRNNLMYTFVAAGSIFTKQVLVIMVGHFGLADETGKISTCSNWFFMAGTFYAMIATASWPAVSNAHKQGDWEWLSRATKKLTAVLVGSGILIGGAVALAGPWVSRAFYEPRFALDTQVCVALGLAVLVQGLEIGLSQYFLAFNLMKRAAIVGIGQALVVLVLGLLLVPTYGYGSALVVMVASECAYVAFAIAALWNPVIKELRKA